MPKGICFIPVETLRLVSVDVDDSHELRGKHAVT